MSLQILHQPDLFDVKGLFKLDMNLLHQMCSAMSAYVITYWNMDMAQ